MFVGFTWWSSFFSVRNDAIRSKHTRPHSGPAHKNTRYFWKRRLFYTNGPCESAHRNRLFLKPLSRMDFLDLTRLMILRWWLKSDTFQVKKKTGPVVSFLNENFQVENGGQQCCRPSSPVLLHVLKSILLFWRQQLAIWNSLKLWNLLVRDEGV